MKNANPTIERLRRVRPFGACTPEELNFIARRMTPHRARPGDVLCRAGSFRMGFFVISDGAAVTLDAHGNTRPLLRGDYFGEIALLAESFSPFTVVAETELEVQVSSSKEFTEILFHAPSFAKRLLGDLARRLHESYPEQQGADEIRHIATASEVRSFTSS